MFSWIQPQDHISAEETGKGLKLLILDAICTQTMGVLTGGAFLVAFALQLGASNVIIGLLSSLGPFAQMLQIPAIFLIERTGLRKATVVTGAFFGRMFWVLIAITPWIVAKPMQIPLLLGSILLYFGLGSVSGLAFSAWMQDFIPENIRGAYFGKRMAVATALSAGLSLLAGISVDASKTRFPELGIYSVLFLIGTSVGILGTYVLSKIPEPRMTKVAPRNIFTVLAEPFQNTNFRQLLIFLGAWSFVTNAVVPFFTVYMLKRIGLSMTIVLGLAVLSQIANVLFFQIWGRLADRFSNKSVLAITGPLFMLSILLFPFSTMPGFYVLTIPILVLIHALAGMSSAGVLLCTGNIALKLAPQGKATYYLAINALVSGVAATIAPILGGIAADWFGHRELRVTFTWTSDAVGRIVDVSAMNLRGLDFLFMFAVVLGMYALHRLAFVKEMGEVEKGVVLLEFYGLVWRSVRHVSNVAGIRHLFHFPYSRLMELFDEDTLSHDDSEMSASPGLFDVSSIKEKMGLNKNSGED